MASRRRGRRKKGSGRLVIQHSREVHRDFRIVIVIAGGFGFLALLGFEAEILQVLGLLICFGALIFFLVRGPSPLFEIVDDEGRSP